MNNALMYLGGVLVVILGALFAVSAFVDWNGYKGVFEEEASRVLGREVRVAGGVNLRILPTPYVSFEKVRLADTIGQTGEPFVRAENFTMRLAIAPMLRGDIEVNEIELNKPVLTLALDGEGSGNWSSVALKSGSLPFLPQNVSLRSVKIADGQVSVYGPGSVTIVRVEAVNGELSAESLKGPYKFKGHATWTGQQHDVKFATALAGSDGNVPINASSRTEGSSNTFALDGTLQDLWGKPKLLGDLTAKLSVPGAATPSKDSKADDALVWDFKSRLTADASGAAFDDIAMSLDSAAEQQLISGTAKSNWNDAGRFEISLASNYLDIDRLAGAGQDSATFEKFKLLSIGLMKAVAGDAPAEAKLDIEQIKVGGETTGGLKIDAERSANGLTIKTLHMGVPGGARLHVSGLVKDDDGKASFAGSGFVHGGSLERLLSWAEKSGVKLDIKADGPFNAGGKLVINDAGFDLTDLSGEIAGRPFSGAVSRTNGDHQKLAVTLEAATLNSAELFPSATGLLKDQIRTAFGLQELPKSGGKQQPAEVQIAEDVTLRLIANELKQGTGIFRNVDATLGFERGDIRIPSARFTTNRGLAVALEGRIRGASSEPSGHLSYEVSAETSEAMKDIASVFGLGGVVAEDRLAGAGPAKAAGIIKLGGRAKGAADITIDGMAGASRISGYAEFDEGLSAWRTGSSRAQISVRGADSKTFRALFGGGAKKAVVLSRPADVKIAVTGSIERGAVTVADIVSEGLQATYTGVMRIPSLGDSNAEGMLALTASDVREALSIAGVGSAAGLAGIPVEGRLAVVQKGGDWQLSSEKFSLGGAIVSGIASVSGVAGGSPHVEADLKANQMSLESLLAGVVEKAPPQPPRDAAADGAETAMPLWPDASFVFDQFGSLAGNVRVAFGSLSLGERWSVRDGSLKLALTPGKVSLAEINGKAAGGEFNGALDFEKVQGGTGLTVNLKLDDIELSSISAAAKGTIAIELSAMGHGSSPASIMASLGGQGHIALKEAVMPGPSTRTGTDLIDAVMQNEVKNEPEAISAAIENLLTSATVNAGSRKVPVVISNGVAKTEPQTFESGQDKLAVMAQANLATLAFESSWRVSSVLPGLALPPETVEGWVPPADKGLLPAVLIAYNGQLDRLSELVPKIDATELQRELAIRQMERNVSELERVRKLDEQRARQDLERRKAADAERAAAAAAAAAQRAAARNADPVQAPPIVPDSNGVAPPAAVQPASRPWTALPQPIKQPDQQRDGGATEAVPEGASLPLQNGPQNTGKEGGAPPRVTVEPSAAAPALPPAAAKPAVAPRPKPRPQPERTTADEISRSLGRFP